MKRGAKMVASLIYHVEQHGLISRQYCSLCQLGLSFFLFSFFEKEELEIYYSVIGKSA